MGSLGFVICPNEHDPYRASISPDVRVVRLPRPPPPPFDIETMRRIEPPWQAIKEWIPDDEPDLDWFHCPKAAPNPDLEDLDQRSRWMPKEQVLDDGRILVLDAD